MEKKTTKTLKPNSQAAFDDGGGMFGLPFCAAAGNI